MTKEMNDITLHEATTPQEDTLSSGLVISQTPALKEVSEALTTLKKNIDHDTPITKKHLKHLEGALASLMVDIGGEPVPLEALPTNENILLWQEIAAGNFENHRKITFLTPRVAQLLSTHKGDLSLNGITTLSDTAAQALAAHKGRYLYLRGITTLSDTAAQALAKHQGTIYCNQEIEDQINRFKEYGS